MGFPRPESTLQERVLQSTEMKGYSDFLIHNVYRPGWTMGDGRLVRVGQGIEWLNSS